MLSPRVRLRSLSVKLSTNVCSPSGPGGDKREVSTSTAACSVRSFQWTTSKVDGGDDAAVTVGKEAGRSADPGAGVEDVVTAGYLGPRRGFAGGDPSRGVEVLEPVEVSGQQLVEVFA